jgi:hypothetical protein
MSRAASESRKAAGCEVCRMGAYKGSLTEPRRIAADPDGPIFLHRCDACGSFWEYDLRSARPVSDEEAAATFPQAFEPQANESS